MPGARPWNSSDDSTFVCASTASMSGSGSSPIGVRCTVGVGPGTCSPRTALPWWNSRRRQSSIARATVAASWHACLFCWRSTILPTNAELCACRSSRRWCGARGLGAVGAAARSNTTLTAVPGIKVGHFTLTETAHRVHGRARRSRGDRRRRRARRRTSHARNRSARSGQPRPDCARHRALGRQRVRARQPQRRHALPRGKEDRLRVRPGARADRAGRGTVRSCRSATASIRPSADCGYKAAAAATNGTCRRRQRRRRRRRHRRQGRRRGARHEGRHRQRVADAAEWPHRRRDGRGQRASATSSIRQPDGSLPAFATADGKTFADARDAASVRRHPLRRPARRTRRSASSRRTRG